MKGMKQIWTLIRIKYDMCLFCKSFNDDYCFKWHIPRSPVSNKCSKFRRNYLFRESLLRQHTFRLIFLLYFMMYFCIGIIPPNIPNIITSISKITEFGISIAIVLNLLVNSVSAIIFGYFRDKLSEKITVKGQFVLTNILWICGYGFLPFSYNYAIFIILLIISAIGTGAFLPLGFSMVGDFFHSKKRGKKFGIMQFGLILGNGLGIGMGLFLGTIFKQDGWRIAYLTLILLNLLILSIYTLTAIQPERGRTDPEFADFQGIINYDYKITKSHLIQLINTKSVIGILLSVLCRGIALSTLANWGIYFLTLKSGSSMFAALIYLIVGVAALPGAIIGGIISDHFFKNKKNNMRFLVSMIAIVTGSLSLLGFYLGNSNYIGLLLPLGILGYFFTSFNSGTQFAIYSEVCIPELRSTANALNGLMLNIGGICGNFLVSIILFQNILFLSYSIFVALLVWLVGSLFWILPFIFYMKDFQKRKRIMINRRVELERKEVYFKTEKMLSKNKRFQNIKRELFM
ncbi:MAG: MFS transporter [Candidatus Thorarchaeota archaeon]